MPAFSDAEPARKGVLLPHAHTFPFPRSLLLAAILSAASCQRATTMLLPRGTASLHRSALPTLRTVPFGQARRAASNRPPPRNRRAPLVLAASLAVAVGLYATTLGRPSLTAEGAAPVHKRKLISMDEVGKHDSLDRGVWVAIEGQVYDVTDFIDVHPGGRTVIVKNAGRDVTDLYMPVHPANAIADNLAPSQHLGAVDPATVRAKQPGDESARDRRRREALESLPPVGSLLNLDDFEVRRGGRARAYMLTRPPPRSAWPGGSSRTRPGPTTRLRATTR